MLSSALKMSVSWFGLAAFFTTCCMSWPTANRRSYVYYPQNTVADMLRLPTSDQWDIAQEPLAYYDPLTEPEDYTDLQWADLEALNNMLDRYEEPALAQAQPAMWGQIVREKPETELEELKEMTFRNREEKSVGGHARSGAVFTTTTSSPLTASRRPPHSPNKLISAQAKPSHTHGQKEIPLLRPPNKGKAQDPAPIIAQRSLPADQKPSPYDTLRKYISIEDALKKEAEKRRAPGSSGNRQVKRSYVADEDSLTGQLNNLKKSVN